RVDGFVAHLATFRNVEVLDIRPLEQKIRNIKFVQADIMDAKSVKKYQNYCDSISSLHAIEHFGLGRYGDDIDIYGHSKGLDNIHKMLKKGGVFYFSVPIGHQRIEFNAMRVFNVDYLLRQLENKYDLISFSYIDDKGELFENVQPGEADECFYGCGIFDLIKR
ncbi:DUF268 domain-containing protein, partial [Patescibacteria group bacterium]